MPIQLPGAVGCRQAATPAVTGPHSEQHESQGDEPPTEEANNSPPQIARSSQEHATERSRFFARCGAQPDKSTPYRSVETKQRHIKNLNGVVELPLSDAVPDICGATAPLCRHFALEYFTASQKRDYFSQVAASKELVRNYFSERLAAVDRAYEETLFGTPQNHRHLVSDRSFGEYVCALAKELDHQVGDAATPPPPLPLKTNVLLLTTDIDSDICGHAMALEVQKKQKKGEQNGPYYTVSFYDPNCTGSHVRMEVAEPKEFIEKLTASKLTGNFNYKDRKASQLSIVCVADRSLPAEDFPQNVFALKPKTDGDFLTEVAAAVRRGLIGAAKSLAEHFNHNSPSDDKFLLLNEQLGPGGLFTTFDSNPLATKAAIAFVEQADVSPDARLRAFTELGRSLQEMGVLYFPLFFDQKWSETTTAVFDAYGKAVGESRLTAEERVELLLCKYEGCPVATYMCGLDRPDVAVAALRVYAKAGLPPEHMETLLAGRDPDFGTKLFDVATRMNHSDVLEAYSEALQASGLSPEAKERLRECGYVTPRPAHD